MANRSSTTARSGSDTSTRELLRTVALTGLAIVVPILISGYALFVAARFLGRFLTPIARQLPGESIIVGQVLAAVLLGVTVLAVGLVAHFRTGARAIDYFDDAVARLPGVGTIYQSFRRMSDVMLESDADHFRDVKLVEFPTEGAYTLAFETAKTHDRIKRSIGETNMQTLFVPMAPNPFMGGFVLHVAEDRVIDADVSVGEGIRATVTSGVAFEAEDEEGFEGARWELSDLRQVPDVDRLRALGIDTDELRAIDRDDLREFGVQDIEERLLVTSDAADGEEGKTAEGNEKDTPGENHRDETDDRGSR